MKLSTPCRAWMGTRLPAGYGRRDAPTESGRTKKVLVHRWVWEQVHGPIPDGMIVMHLCDHPACFRLDHLSLGTTLDNARDAASKGRQNKGTDCHSAKLTEETVLSIYNSAEYGNVLAARYGVADATISRIRSGETWRHLTGHPHPKLRKQQITKEAS